MAKIYVYNNIVTLNFGCVVVVRVCSRLVVCVCVIFKFLRLRAAAAAAAAAAWL